MFSARKGGCGLEEVGDGPGVGEGALRVEQGAVLACQACIHCCLVPAQTRQVGAEGGREREEKKKKMEELGKGVWEEKEEEDGGAGGGGVEEEEEKDEEEGGA